MNSRTQTSRSPARLILMAALLLPLLVAGCGNQSGGASEAMSHITRAETYADQGQYRSAMVEVRNAIQAEPENVSHIIYLAELSMEVGATRQATELMLPWLESHPQRVTLPLARAYVERGKQLSATETLDGFSPESPTEKLEMSLIRAEALRLAGEITDALDRFQALLKSNPSNVEAIKGVARSHLDLNQSRRAIESLDEWLDSNGGNATVFYLKGIAQYRDNSLEEASETLTAAVGELPQSDVFLPIRRNIILSLSRVLTEQGKITEAQVYNRILAENSNTDIQEKGNTVISAIQDGEIEQAKAVLRDMLKLDPDNQRAALMLGVLSASSGDLDEGARLLTENLDPETSPTQFIRAATMAQVDTGAREEALQTLERAVEARPNDNDLLALHGILALSLPEHEDAGIASLSKAIANEPERVRLRLALAQHYIRKDLPEQALGQLRMAFTADPSDWNTTGTYLELLLQQGENTEAEEIRDSLLNGYPEEPSATLLASMGDAQLGNTDAALERLESLVADEPGLQAPQVALAMLYNETNQRDKAVSTLIDAAKLTPDIIQPLQQAGRIYAQDHSIEQVETWLEKIGADNPNLKQNADLLAAMLKIRRGDLVAARNILGPLSDAESTPVKRATAQLLQAEAISAARSGDYKSARSKAAEAVALEPDNLRFAMLQVGIAREEGQLQQAMSALEGVQETFGDQRPVLLARAELIRQTNGRSQAYDYLEGKWRETGDAGLIPSLLELARSEAPDSLDDLTSEWLEASPDDMAAHMARAEWLMSNGQEVVSASHYEQVLSRQPDNVAALNNLAWILKEKDEARALELARRASNLAPENAAVLDTYGWILHLQGEHGKAKDNIEKALGLAPDNQDIRNHLDAVNKAL